MILLTRLGGPVFALNPDLVERADCTPDTVITLVDGKKYVVAESLPEVITLIRQFRATVVADAQQLTGQQDNHNGRAGRGTPAGHAGHADHSLHRRSEHTGASPADTDAAPGNVVHLHRRER